MKTAQQLLDDQFLLMRERILSLAADFDRIERAAGGVAVVSGDPRLKQLQACVKEILSAEQGRAARVQMTLSDRSPLK